MVGVGDEKAGVAGKGFHAGSADGDGEMDGLLKTGKEDGEVLDGVAELFAEREGSVEVGGGKDDGEFFTAVAGDDVAGAADVFFEAMGDCSEAKVADGMAFAVVKGFEVVYVKHEQGEGKLGTGGAKPLLLKGLVEETAIVDPGETVVEGEL